MNIFNLMNQKDNNAPAPIPERLRKNEKVIIITADNVEDLEFYYPYYRFCEAGYDVDVVTPTGGNVKGKHGYEIKNTKNIKAVKTSDYVMLEIPGGKAPEELRKDMDVIAFVREFAATGKPIAAICHGPQVLASAGIIKGIRMTGWPEIKDEIADAGAIYADEALVESGQFISARKPGDLHRYMDGIMNTLKERGSRKKVAANE
jgi:protease I